MTLVKARDEGMVGADQLLSPTAADSYNIRVSEKVVVLKVEANLVSIL